MQKELSPTATYALIAAAVLVVGALAIHWYRSNDPTTAPFGTAPPGAIDKARQQAQQQGAQAASQAARTRGVPGATGTPASQ
jgi:hypothetical protein